MITQNAPVGKDQRDECIDHVEGSMIEDDYLKIPREYVSLLFIKNSLYDLHEFFLDKLSSNLRDGILSTTSGQSTIR
jgi:hypothetical protein